MRTSLPPVSRGACLWRSAHTARQYTPIRRHAYMDIIRKVGLAVTLFMHPYLRIYVASPFPSVLTRQYICKTSLPHFSRATYSNSSRSPLQQELFPPPPSGAVTLHWSLTSRLVKSSDPPPPQSPSPPPPLPPPPPPPPHVLVRAKNYSLHHIQKNCST